MGSCGEWDKLCKDFEKRFAIVHWIGNFWVETNPAKKDQERRTKQQLELGAGASSSSSVSLEQRHLYLLNEKQKLRRIIMRKTQKAIEQGKDIDDIKRFDEYGICLETREYEYEL